MIEKLIWKRLSGGLWFILCLLILLLSFPKVSSASETIVIEYWQPATSTGVAVMNQIVALFETQYPNIRIEYVAKLPHTPVNRYEPALNEALRIGEGPDVVTLFNGWLPSWVSAGYLIPLPEDVFPPEAIEADFFPIVTSSRYQGNYWALPTAVRTMALFYNKDIFDAAGVAYPEPNWTWEDMARKAGQIDNANLEGVAGFDWEISGWGHHWLREVLVPQFGGQSYVDYPSEAIWESPAACEAFSWLLSLEVASRPTSVEVPDGNRSPGNYFISGQTAMHVDGSFRLRAANNREGFNYGVVPLPIGPLQGPEGNYLPRTFGSYWTHGLTPRALEDKSRYEAALTFLNFITSPEIGIYWMEATGELAAQQDAISEEMVDDEFRGPFLRSLNFAFATPFADESSQLSVLTQAYDSVIIDNADPCDALNSAGGQIQEILDDFVENQQRWERR
jgi:multiple sugar transport system substrate-binding protein